MAFLTGGINKRAYNICVAEMKSSGMSDADAQKACKAQSAKGQLAGDKKKVKK